MYTSLHVMMYDVYCIKRYTILCCCSTKWVGQVLVYNYSLTVTVSVSNCYLSFILLGLHWLQMLGHAKAVQLGWLASVCEAEYSFWLLLCPAVVSLLFTVTLHFALVSNVALRIKVKQASAGSQCVLEVVLVAFTLCCACTDSNTSITISSNSS